jgi:hypothetical protein
MANWWDTYQDHSCKWQRGGGERISPNSIALDEVVLLQIKNNEPKFRSQV